LTGTEKTGALFPRAALTPVGDTGLLVELGDGIDLEVNQRVHAMSRALMQLTPKGVREVIPAYRSFMVIYDPWIMTLDHLALVVASLETSPDSTAIPDPRTVTIPVAYGGDYGPDIGFVAQHNGLSIADVIRIHTSAEYRIYMMGFTPGFAYLGGLHESLRTPRLETPRPSVPAGSVGIANNQTGIYPVESPAGWRIIGRTPMVIFNPLSQEPFLYRAGDVVVFESISATEFEGPPGRWCR
jgi:inhibitor of KinA